MAARRDDEAFPHRLDDRSSPAVEPLRIHKRESAASPTPSSSSNQNLSGTSAPSHYPIPSLPDPDSRQKSQESTPSNATPGTYPYPESRRMISPEHRRYGSPEQARMGSPSQQSSKNSSSPSSASQASSGWQRHHDARDGRSATTLGERRGNLPKPLPDSPGPETPDKEGLFQKPPLRSAPPGPHHTVDNHAAGQVPRQDLNPYPGYHPPFSQPGSITSTTPAGLPDRLNTSEAAPVQRLSSTASTSTTKATRGSPPPPETPVVPPNPRPGTDIEARYAAAGIAGTSTLTNLRAQNAAAVQRSAPYVGLQPSHQESIAAHPPPGRPWTPTEQPGSHPHGQPTIYQGPGEAVQQPPLPNPHQAQTMQTNGNRGGLSTALDSDMQRLHVGDEPPPAYSQAAGAQSGYPTEKGGPGAEGGRGGPNRGEYAREGIPNTLPSASPAPTQASGGQVSIQDHPAYSQQQQQQPQQQHPTHHANAPARQPSVNGSMYPPQQQSVPAPQQTPAPSLAASPPPLPEGWIAHMDPNSGQYYYIHLPTQSTQWEFPKGPTPLNLNEAPLSPVSTYNHPLSSPGLSFAAKPMSSPGLPMTPGYDHPNSMSLGGNMTGPAAYTGPPPNSGVDLYKIVPTNGVYFGPYLRYVNMDLERDLWLGSILLVTDAPQPPTIHIHQSLDLSANPRQLNAVNISQHQRWTFYKYEIDLKMEDATANWTYAITSHLGCTRYEFLVAGRHDTNWRFVAHSGNDFGLNVSTNERARLGGIGYMWKDVLQKHGECGGFHCQIGLGGQIYADRLWKEIPSLKQWLAMSGKENRKNAAWTAAHEEDVCHAFFHYYTSHFDQPHLREAFAQIPHVLALDDHDL